MKAPLFLSDIYKQSNYPTHKKTRRTMVYGTRGSCTRTPADFTVQAPTHSYPVKMQAHPPI